MSRERARCIGGLKFFAMCVLFATIVHMTTNTPQMMMGMMMTASRMSGVFVMTS